jgi:hypothetical protein
MRLIMLNIIWDMIVDHIPTWGWVVIIGAPVGAALYFAGPILLPIWNMLPTPVKLLLGGMVAAFLAYMGGRARGRWNAEEEERQRDADALRKRTEVDNAIDKKSPDQVQQDLRKRWSRDDAG